MIFIQAVIVTTHPSFPNHTLVIAYSFISCLITLIFNPVFSSYLCKYPYWINVKCQVDFWLCVWKRLKVRPAGVWPKSVDPHPVQWARSAGLGWMNNFAFVNDDGAQEWSFGMFPFVFLFLFVVVAPSLDWRRDLPFLGRKREYCFGWLMFIRVFTILTQWCSFKSSVVLSIREIKFFEYSVLRFFFENPKFMLYLLVLC
jgi:hypothetical protein